MIGFFGGGGGGGIVGGTFMAGSCLRANERKGK